MLNLSSLRDDLIKKKVLVIGGLNVDVIFSYEREPANDGCEIISELFHVPGGHAANCASALSKLGVNTWVAGAVGNDAEGRFLLEDLAKNNIHADFVAVVDQITGKVIIPKSSLKHSMFMFRGANDNPEIINTLKKIDFEMFDCVVVFDPAFEVIDLLISLNIKPKTFTVWNPGGVLTKSTSIMKRLLFPKALIFNNVEFKSVSQMPSFQKSSLLQKNDPLKLIVTQGSLGSMLISNSELHFDAFEVVSIDPTGAGDAFTAGYSIMEMLNQKIEVCMRFGNLLGGLATRGIGARATLPDFFEIEKWEDKIYDSE